MPCIKTKFRAKQDMKKISLLALLTLVAATTFAQAVSQQEACQRAEKFLKKQVVTSPLTLTDGETAIQNLGARKAKSLKQTTSGPLPYYIYNAQDGQGYVIVSGDERAREILGYSETGSLYEETMPCGMKMLLDLYAQEIESLDDNASLSAPALAPKKVAATDSRVNVSTLMSCQWGQSSPYNGQCPKYGSRNCIVGCAATATSQVMYYWGHQRGYDLPATAIPAYTTRNLGLRCEELPATTFDWASMRDAASSDAAAAKLCRYVGQALEMDYGTSASEAWGSDIGIVYRDYFGYDQHTRLVFRQDYDYDTFEQMIYDEMAAGRPVVITGSYINSDGSSWGGHSFVCDGYQSSNGYYHINWGWNGSNDGYFPLSSLNSSLNAYGSSNTTGKGFDIYLNCVIGIQPPVEGHEYEEEESRAAIVDMSIVGSRTFSRSSQDEAFEGLTIFNAVYNHLQHNVELVAGLGLYDEGGKLIEVLDQAPLGRFDRYDGFGLEFTFGNLAMGKGLGDGTYYIRSISRGTAEGDTWGLSTDADHNYLTATIVGNQLTLQPSVDLDVTVTSSGSSGGWYSSRSYVATVTNNGTEESRGLLYCFSSSKLLNVIQTDVAPGETKTYTIGSSSIAKVTSDFDGHHVLWANSSSTQNIALTARAIDADLEGKFPGQTLRLDVSVTNNGTTTYGTSVSVKLCREGNSTAVATRSFTPSVPAGGIQTERLEFEGLTYDQPYTITLTSGSYTVQVGEMTTSQPRTFYVYTVTPTEQTLLLGDVNLDGEVTIADVTELVNIILGKTSPSLSQGGEDAPVADVNGDGLITIADVTALVNLILAK